MLTIVRLRLSLTNLYARIHIYIRNVVATDLDRTQKLWSHCRLTAVSFHARSPSKPPGSCRNPSPITSNTRAIVACTVVRRLSPAPVIRAVTQQHVALGRQHLGRGNRRSSSPESPQLLYIHRGCSQHHARGHLGHVMGVVRVLQM